MIAASETKLYAQFKAAAYSIDDSVEIENVKQAVEYGLEHQWISFQTYEVTMVDFNGEILKGEPKNLSGTYHLSVSKVITAADIAALYAEKVNELRPVKLQEKAAFNNMSFPIHGTVNEKDAYRRARAKVEENEALMHSYAAMREHFSALPPETLYFDDPHGRGGEYIEIKENDVVFNKSGQQVYPQPVASGAKSKPAMTTADKQQQLQAEARRRKLNIRQG